MKRRLAAGITAVAALSFFTLAIEASDNYTVNHGTDQNVTAHSTCRKVTNNSGTNASVYVPTQTVAEWQSFYTNPPAGVAIGSCGCALPWGGTINHGQSVTAYQTSSGHSCTLQTRTCTNGVLSGSYQYQSCTDTCGGASVGGYCWYMGGASQSCTTVCNSHGGYDAGTRSYAGSDGTDAQCTAVLNALGYDGSPVTRGWTNYGIGCGYHGGAIRYAAPYTTTAGGTASGRQRACACNQ